MNIYFYNILWRRKILSICFSKYAATTICNKIEAQSYYHNIFLNENTVFIENAVFITL